MEHSMDVDESEESIFATTTMNTNKIHFIERLVQDRLQSELYDFFHTVVLPSAYTNCVEHLRTSQALSPDQIDVHSVMFEQQCYLEIQKACSSIKGQEFDPRVIDNMFHSIRQKHKGLSSLIWTYYRSHLELFQTPGRMIRRQETPVFIRSLVTKFLQTCLYFCADHIARIPCVIDVRCTADRARERYQSCSALIVTSIEKALKALIPVNRVMVAPYTHTSSMQQPSRSPPKVVPFMGPPSLHPSRSSPLLSSPSIPPSPSAQSSVAEQLSKHLMTENKVLREQIVTVNDRMERMRNQVIALSQKQSQGQPQNQFPTQTMPISQPTHSKSVPVSAFSFPSTPSNSLNDINDFSNLNNSNQSNHSNSHTSAHYNPTTPSIMSPRTTSSPLQRPLSPPGSLSAYSPFSRQQHDQQGQQMQYIQQQVPSYPQNQDMHHNHHPDNLHPDYQQQNIHQQQHIEETGGFSVDWSNQPSSMPDLHNMTNGSNQSNAPVDFFNNPPTPRTPLDAPFSFPNHSSTPSNASLQGSSVHGAQPVGYDY